jgi:Ni/Co efflux regulator RcnB
MRRLISFLLLATAAAAPLAAQVRDGQGSWRGDRGDRADGGYQGGERRAGNRAAAPQATQAPQAAFPDRAAPGQLAQRYDGDPRRDGRNDRRDWNRNDNRYDGRPGDGNIYRPGNNDGFANRRGDWRDDRGRNGAFGNRGFADDGRNGWNNQWRNDRRYDWQGYRSSNRDLFRAPRYYGPRGYDYSRWSRGYRVQPFFYGQNYWISDPWRYRLPPAYGDYRWVRYYDDVALIDIRTGLIADIIYSFFWR